MRKIVFHLIWRLFISFQNKIKSKLLLLLYTLFLWFVISYVFVYFINLDIFLQNHKLICLNIYVLILMIFPFEIYLVSFKIVIKYTIKQGIFKYGNIYVLCLFCFRKSMNKYNLFIYYK